MLLYTIPFKINILFIYLRGIQIQIMKASENKFASATSLDDIFNNKQAAEIMKSYGPTLDSISQTSRSLSTITPLTCTDFINKLAITPNKQIKFAGAGKQALLHSLSFILLTIASKQIKFYPHLLTLIKQQFFKPGIFADYEPQRRSKILNICRNIQIELISSGNVWNFFQDNEQFLNGFEHVLNKIIPSHIDSSSQIVESLRKKFNIDCGKIPIPNSVAECWILGMQKKIYLIQQNSYYIIAASSSDSAKNMSQSAIQNRPQSQREFSDVGQQVIIEASEQSTPKFKQNQESIRYRRKSHKNSFGGDFEITGYKQLANILNKSHAGDQNKQRQKVKKAFSLKFQMQDMGGLTYEGEDYNNKQIPDDAQTVGKNQQDFNLMKPQNSKMRGSNIQGNKKQEKNERKRHVTSSQIFQLSSKSKKKNQFQIQKLQQQQNSNTNSNSNNTSGKDKAAKQKQGENIQKAQEETPEKAKLGIPAGPPKENFKFSFSKKDQGRFVFKQIQSQLNDHEPHGVQYDFANDHTTKNKPIQQLMKSSLTNLKSDSAGSLLYEGEYFKKKENNRRSLLLQTTITPIQQQVQSSQQQKTQEQSIPQSQRQRERQFQNLQQDNQIQKNKEGQLDGNQSFNWNTNKMDLNNENNSKNLINIFKNKNRKFSYLTQPISISKNSLFGGNNQLRQSYIDESNENIIQEGAKNQSSNNVHNPPNYIQRAHRNNKVKKAGKSPKFHKNSQAVTQSKSNKRRFQQNPISFSQMIANGQQSNFSVHSQKNVVNKRQPKLSFNLNLYEFVKSDAMCYNEPAGWIRKQVTYYFDEPHRQIQNKNIQKKVFRRPQRFIVERTSQTISQSQNYNQAKKKQNEDAFNRQMAEKQNRIQRVVTQQRQRVYLNGAISQTGSSNSHNVNPSQMNPFMSTQTSKRVVSNVNQSNNIRSTIDTSINTRYKASKVNYSAKNISNTSNRRNISSPPAFIRNLIIQNPQHDIERKNERARVEPSHYPNAFYKNNMPPQLPVNNNKNTFNNIFSNSSNYIADRQNLQNFSSDKSLNIDKYAHFSNSADQVKNNYFVQNMPTSQHQFWPGTPSHPSSIAPSYSMSTLRNFQQNRNIKRPIVSEDRRIFDEKSRERQRQRSVTSVNSPSSHYQAKQQTNFIYNNNTYSFSPQFNEQKTQPINKNLSSHQVINITPNKYVKQFVPAPNVYRLNNVSPNNHMYVKENAVHSPSSRAPQNIINPYIHAFSTFKPQSQANIFRQHTSPTSSNSIKHIVPTFAHYSPHATFPQHGPNYNIN